MPAIRSTARTATSSRQKSGMSGTTRTTWGNEALGGGEDELLAQRPQKASVAHGEVGTGGGLLGGLLGGGYYRETANPRGLDPPPLGRSSLPTAMSLSYKLQAVQ